MEQPSVSPDGSTLYINSPLLSFRIARHLSWDWGAGGRLPCLGAEKPLACAGQHDGLRIGAIAAVACATRIDRHHVTGLHRIALHARPQQLTGTRHFEPPVRDGAVLVLDVHEKPGVGIGPLDLGHRPGQFNGLSRVKFSRERMVRHRLSGRGERGNAKCDRKSSSHHCFPVVGGVAWSRPCQYCCRLPRSRLFSQRCSSSSVSGCRSNRIVSAVQGREYALGSSMVTASSMRPKLIRRNRSVIRSASVCGWPWLSSQLPSLKPAVSTTKVSPSQRPTE